MTTARLDIVDELAAQLGHDAVETDADALNSRSHDWWPVTAKWAGRGHHPYPAEVVVRAGTEADVSAVLRLASRTGSYVTPWGLGSSVTGQALPVRGGIVLDLSRLVGPIELDERDLTVTVPAGNRGSDVERELRQRGFTLGHSPQSLARSSVGGWLATMASGQFSSRYGGIEDLVTGYTVVLADGEPVRLRASPRRALGPDLRQLFLGAEGTLGVFTSVTLKVFPTPEHRRLDAVRMPSVSAGLDFLREQAALGLRPFLLRFYDTDEARHVSHDPGRDAPLLFVGSEGVRAVADAEHDELLRLAGAHGGRPEGPDLAQAWMARRFDFSAVENRLATPGGYAETIEVAHNWSQLDTLYTALKHRLAAPEHEVLGHFSHVYTQGSSLYLIILGQTTDDAEAERALGTLWAAAMETCLAHGAELSHHHGGGLARAPYLERALGPSLAILRRVKNALDPNDTLNPGKLGL